MTINTVKRLFIPIHPTDRANFYTFQTIHTRVPRWEYTFKNCSEGFIALMERSSIKCWIDEKHKTVGIKIENPVRTRTIEYSSENLTKELIEIKKERG